MNDAVKRIADARRFGQGTSASALRRRADRTQGRIIGGKPGSVVKDSRGKAYAVAPDGSLRRLVVLV